MLLVAILNGFYAFGTVCISCELSQHACDAVNAFDVEIGQLDWYLYPIGMKKTLPMIIKVAQKPVVIKGFGSMAANRELLKKVNEYLLLCRPNSTMYIVSISLSLFIFRLSIKHILSSWYLENSANKSKSMMITFFMNICNKLAMRGASTKNNNNIF